MSRSFNHFLNLCFARAEQGDDYLDLSCLLYVKQLEQVQEN